MLFLSDLNDTASAQVQNNFQANDNAAHSQVLKLIFYANIFYNSALN